MPEIEHNRRNFYYRVNWRRDIPVEDWNIEMISDWRQSSISISNQPTFKRYRIEGKSHQKIGLKLKLNSILLSFVLHSCGVQSGW